MKDTFTEDILAALERVVSRQYSTCEFCIGCYQEESVCIQPDGEEWIVYNGERGNKYGEVRCDTVLMATLIFFRILTHRTEIIQEMENELLQQFRCNDLHQ